jgi:hypothetical protein
MNAVEIEEAVSALAEEAFDAAEFPFSFLEAFGNKPTTINRLRSGNSNSSDIDNGVLQRSNIHLAVSEKGGVATALTALRGSPKTDAGKCKFILATDGEWLEAEDLNTGETVACKYEELPDHFGFFLSLAGISTVKQIRDNPIDVRATSRLNQLYVELLRENPDWESEDGRHNMNHFMAKLIFCFFAEDTGIFLGENLFTDTIEQMSDSREGNIDFVISECFRAMDTKVEDRAKSKLPRWADAFPYVNGELFGGENLVPKFTRRARSFLIHAGKLDWQAINPDIFGSMIQAIAEDEERGELGMHYTNEANILKVLNPLFLDDLREQLEAAGDNARKLLNLRNRIAKIRVFDPACGSGNFLVIAYKQMREIEFEVNKRRGEAERRSDIPLTNFRGIEIRDFACEVARLALIIAEYQCDVAYRDQKSALAEFLPLDSKNWITCGNALRLDWLSICPPTGEVAKIQGDDLFETPLDQSEIDFANKGGETFICGNPPYLGSQRQSAEQKEDLKRLFHDRLKNWKSLDYVSGWFVKTADFGKHSKSTAAFVTTNSICQGRQAESLWTFLLQHDQEIVFAYTSFKWTNLASHNAGVTVAIVGFAMQPDRKRVIFSSDKNGKTSARKVDNINPYLIAGPNFLISAKSQPQRSQYEMLFGNMANDGGFLLIDTGEADIAVVKQDVNPKYIRRFVGSQEFIKGLERRCVWVLKDDYLEARHNQWISHRFDEVQKLRSSSDRSTTKALSSVPYRFGEVRQSGKEKVIIIPRVTSESREFLPTGYLNTGTIISDSAFAIYDAPLWNMALIASRIHLVWIATVCGKLKTDFRYSNTLGWNTFPVPKLTEKNKQDLTKCAADILLAREAHFPKTIADLYKPDDMPENLRAAHERNDEVLERIYIGRRFKNDTERLEKLFELYSKMIEAEEKGKQHA